MQPKPKHLAPEYGAQFQDSAIVAAYHHRPPYPAETFTILAGLVRDEPRTVLDLGCGTGDVARPLAPLVARLDAVDISAAMIAKGRTLPGGDHPHLRWIVGPAEAAPVAPPYALVTAGESIHWMDWPVVLPRLRSMLPPHGYLALVGRAEQPSSWTEDLLVIIRRHSTNRDYRPYNIIDELTTRGLFALAGEERTPPMPFSQPLAGYIESLHSRNGLSRDRMPPESVAAFDEEVAALVGPYCQDGMVALQIAGTVVWGHPLAPVAP